MSDEDEAKLGRRAILGAAVGVGLGACGSSEAGPDEPPPRPGPPERPAPAVPAPRLRPLGRTGASVGAVSLGGEGVLRSTGRDDDAVAMITAALRGGERYCDTAPAYSGSQGYYGRTFSQLGAAARDGVFLASKTHARDRDGALSLLAESLRTIGTDHLDLWQLHDLRDQDTLDRIFGAGGAIEAVREAKEGGRVRFAGITGHADPEILLAAMERFDFDAVLLPINPSDGDRRPFVTTVIPEARRRGMAVIGMKVFAAGRILEDGVATVEECLRYSASLADTVIIGCGSAAEARQNLTIGATLTPMSQDERDALETRIAASPNRYDYFKRP